MVPVFNLTVQGAEVNFLVGRTSANQLFVLCESSGWNPKPQISLLDSRRTEVPDAKMEVSVRPDGLFVVKKHLGEGSVFCPDHILNVDLNTPT